MRVVIVGAGEVGSNIAESLASEHEVVVVDVDADRVESLTYDLDVLPVEGDGAALSTLEEADIGQADMLIASTDDDETNIVTCGTAKTCGDEVFTVARVKNTKFLDTWEHSPGALGVDFMVGTNLLTAEVIAQVIDLPGATDVDVFADGRIRMAELAIGEDSPVAGQTVQEADRFESLTFAAIIRPDEVVVPTGQTVIRAGDDVLVIGSPHSVSTFAAEVAPEVDGADDVLVVGGTEIGYHTARILAERGLSPRLVEPDPERARTLAEDLPGVTVLEHDPTDRAFLERENIDRVDVVVAALPADERNLLVGLLGKRLGAERSVAVVNEGENVDLFEAVGVDAAVNPRRAVAEEITRFTREQRTENVAIVENDRAEVLEIEVDEDSVLAGRPIRESDADLPPGVVVGGITRNGSFVIPRGDTVIETGDHVVVFVHSDVLEDVSGKL